MSNPEYERQKRRVMRAHTVDCLRHSAKNRGMDLSNLSDEEVFHLFEKETKEQTKRIENPKKTKRHNKESMT